MLENLRNFSTPKFAKYQGSESIKLQKSAIFEFQILVKLISCKIECEVNSRIVDLNFTFESFWSIVHLHFADEVLSSKKSYVSSYRINILLIQLLVC